MDQKIRKVLSELEKQSDLEKSGKADVHHDDLMLAITPDTGNFFNILLKTSKTKRVLEIGTSTGYSTLWFADALKENHGMDCKIISIEQNTSKIKRAKDNFEKADVSNIIEVKNGTALDVLNELQKAQLEKFDFVFIDADKESVIQYFDLVFPIVKVGGIIAVDNILYPEKFRPGMKVYSKHVQTNPNIESVTIPIGNGEEISLKVSDIN